MTATAILPGLEDCSLNGEQTLAFPGTLMPGHKQHRAWLGQLIHPGWLKEMTANIADSRNLDARVADVTRVPRV